MNTPNPNLPTLGLVLSGGGARAAYQVGALQGLVEVLKSRFLPFKVFTGVSAGAINAVSLASGTRHFANTVENLTKTWRELTIDKVFRTDTMGLLRTSSNWIKDLGGGGILGKSKSTHLLDTSPLAKLLAEKIEFKNLRHHIKRGKVRGVSITATNYLTGTAISFFEGADDIEPWVRSTRMGLRQELTHAHIVASSAIPIFFPPIKIGDVFYGDGCVRLSAPLSPAIHLGADKIVAIGIRYFRSLEQTVFLNQTLTRKEISMSDIAGVLLNAVFLDSLDSDLERLNRINETLALLGNVPVPHKLRPIPVLALRPSRDLGSLASDQYDQFPKMLRFMLKGIGASSKSGWDLLSYLAFEPGYVHRLMELGYEDVLRQKTRIEEFFA